MSDAVPSRIEGDERPLILHLSGDFPDTVEPFKTKAIQALLDLAQDDFDHHVVSINRVDPGLVATVRHLARASSLPVSTQPFEYGTAIRYTAPGKGLRHRTKLVQLGDWLAGYIGKLERRPDLLIGHKLSIEGIAVQRASTLTGIPFALSIQGNTDTKILKLRRDLRPHLGKVLAEAEIVFPFAPWALKDAQGMVKTSPKRTQLLPCATELDSPLAPSSSGTGLVSVFHLKNYDDKNFARLVQAQRELAKRTDVAPLEIIGGGSEADWEAARSIVGDAPAIKLTGALDREGVRARLNQASAMVMPSQRETFGLAFVEALFAGAPIIYPQGRAVDGYFDGCGFALRVDPMSPSSVANAMEHALANEREMKAELAVWQQSEEAKRFTRTEIARSFREGLLSALNTPKR